MVCGYDCGVIPSAKTAPTLPTVAKERGKVEFSYVRARKKSLAKKLAKRAQGRFFPSSLSKNTYGWVAELADAGDLKSLASNGVRVRAPP